MKVNIWSVAALIFLVWAVVASGIAVSYYQTSQNQATTISNLHSVVNDTAMKISIGIDYGNGTVSWYNNTYVPVGVNALNATRLVANVSATYDATYGEYYVTGINGINGTVTSSTSGTAWGYSVWENGTSTSPFVGADQYLMKNGDILVWTFAPYSF
jgi:hypothetical protein